MDYHTLFDVVVELAYRLAMNGAETFRIEDSVNRIMSAYQVNAEVFAIPNCLHVSIETPDGTPITRVRRIGFHGSNLYAVEKYSNISRKICAEKPEPAVAMQWLNETTEKQIKYPFAINLLGNFLGAAGFCILFGGAFTDSLSAGVCGIVIGLVTMLLDNLKANPFFKTISASFLMAVIAYLAAIVHIAHNVDAVIIGALMILVPGLLFTNAMRDIIYGDTNSGVNRVVHVFLIAAAIALGTGAAWSLINSLISAPIESMQTNHLLITELIACYIGCLGFVILFNIHGFGSFLCAFGSVLAWLTFRIIGMYGGGIVATYFWATVTATVYSEIMARLRKQPAISYQVISIFPLIPGAGVYYTMTHAVRSDMISFANEGIRTVAIAGIMAVGILLSSATARMISLKIQQNKRRSTGL